MQPRIIRKFPAIDSINMDDKDSFFFFKRVLNNFINILGNFTTLQL